MWERTGVDYDIVIATYKRENMLRTLLQSIPKNIGNIFIYFDPYDKETWEKFKDDKDINIILLSDHVRGSIDVCNIHSKKFYNHNIILLTDDTECMPNCLENAIKCFETTYPDTDGIVGLNQFEIKGRGGRCGFFIAGNKFIDRFENRELFYSGYYGLCCDTELAEVAEKLEKFTICNEAKIKHWHPVGENKKNFIPDETRINAHKHDKEDLKLFKQRMSTGEFMNRVRK